MSTRAASSGVPRAEPAMWGMVLWMVFMGVAHFIWPKPFLEIVPPYLPAPLMLVYVSGVFELLGGLGLAYGPTRRFSAWGLIALYLAVFPANIHMASNQITPGGFDPLPAWAQYARLPLQVVFIAWAYRYTRLPRQRPAQA